MFWTLNGVPGGPHGGRPEAMSFRDIERPELVMPGAALGSVLGTHAVNQLIEIRQGAVRNE
jgi:hypothetical protein